jgi:hypothetical protein
VMTHPCMSFCVHQQVRNPVTIEILVSQSIISSMILWPVDHCATIFLTIALWFFMLSEIQMALTIALYMVICGGFQKCFKYRQKCATAERRCSRWK